MELKRIISSISYRIEEKPGGGFIALASDSQAPSLEAPTRTELEEKIRSRVIEALAAQFPGLKLPLESKDFNLSFHVEPKPGGGFVMRSNDENAPPIEGDSHEEVEHRFAEKMAGVVGKYLLPEFSKMLTEQLKSGDIRVSVNRMSVSRPAVKLFGKAADHASVASTENTSAGTIEVNDNSPIQPVADRSSTILRVLLVLVAVAVILYFFMHR